MGGKGAGLTTMQERVLRTRRILEAVIRIRRRAKNNPVTLGILLGQRTANAQLPGGVHQGADTVQRRLKRMTIRRLLKGTTGLGATTLEGVSDNAQDVRHSCGLIRGNVGRTK